MPVTISPEMNLPIPDVSSDPGPDWANNLNSCLSAIDSHDHTSGKGVPITPDGININSDLVMNDYPLTMTQSVVFQPQASLATLKALYVISNDIYFNDGAGNVIRITQGGSVAGASGTITGLPSGTASASYQSVGGTFRFQSATNTPANIDGASFIVREQVASPNGITVKSPTSLAANYNLTLPAAAPAATSFVTMSSAGALATRSITAPTVQKFTSGTGTYTTPAGVLYIRVRMVGGGGGGAGSGTGAVTAGGTGGSSTFGTAFLTAAGGNGGTDTGPGGGGGSSTIATGTGLTVFGSGGGTGSILTTINTLLIGGGAGGNSMLGGGGASSSTNAAAGNPGAANSGGGGGGASFSNNANSRGGAGGGGGGGIDIIITAPSASYGYAVGAAGAAGSAGTAGAGGGAGGSGVIIVEEFYQ